MSKSQKTALAVLVIGVFLYWALFTKDVKTTTTSIKFDVGFDVTGDSPSTQTNWGDRQSEDGSVITTTK